MSDSYFQRIRPSTYEEWGVKRGENEVSKGLPHTISSCLFAWTPMVYLGKAPFFSPAISAKWR